MVISSADLPSASLPEETSQIGDASQMDRARKAMESQGTGRRTQPGASPSGGPPPAAAGGQQAPPAGPVQPQPRQPLTAQDLRPGGPVFMQPKMLPDHPWRQQLKVWAQHPEARILRQLSQRAEAQFGGGAPKPETPPQQ